PTIQASAKHDKVNSTIDVSTTHPRLLFSQSDLPEIKRRATLPILQPTVKRLLERAEWQLTALAPVGAGNWPQEALTLLWRLVGEAWLPEAQRDFKPQLDPVFIFPSIGWGMMTPHQPDPPYFLAFKNGSLAANHTHLDLNHISIGYGDTMLAVELGSRPYPADYF